MKRSLVRLAATSVLAAVLSIGLAAFQPTVLAACGAQGGGANCKGAPAPVPAPPAGWLDGLLLLVDTLDLIAL